jgi:hypothetical protein
MGAIADLCRDEDRFTGATHPDQFDCVLDPIDRDCPALADAAGAPLGTRSWPAECSGQAPFPILKPSEFELDE